jgi:hypothetical protein
MPDAKNNAKMTGDTHLPDVESDLPVQEGSDGAVGEDGTPRDRGRASELGKEGQAGRGINQAGFLKDKDDETGNSGSNVRDLGEKPGSGDR